MSADLLYVKHMLECMDDIQTHLSAAEALGVVHWSKHITTREAMYHTLHTLAESGDKLSVGAKKQMPEIAWHEVKGLRNVLVHEYLGNIDDTIIDDIIRDNLPEMKQALKRVLPTLS